MSIYLQIASCFAAIAIAALLAEKTRMFFAPFYILVGILLGPNALNLINDVEIIKLFGEIGLVFLLFSIGLEFSVETLFKQKKKFLSAGFIDFIVNFSLGFFLGLILGLNVFYSLVVAGAIYMSSSGIIIKTLLELEISNKPEGNLIMSIMIFEDLVMIIFLVFITTGFSSGLNPIDMLIQLGKSLLFCGLILFSAKKIPNFYDRILRIEKKELLLLVFFGFVLILTAVGELFGVSDALTAFFLGMAFSNSINKENIKHKTIVIRNLFGSVFFFSFGLLLQFNNFSLYWEILIYGSAIAIIGKLLSSFIITKTQKCEKKMSLFIGFITLPRGEFSLLISQLCGNAIPFLQPVIVVLVLLTTFISSIVLNVSKILCKLYNVCFIYPRTRIPHTKKEEFGEDEIY